MTSVAEYSNLSINIFKLISHAYKVLSSAKLHKEVSMVTKNRSFKYILNKRGLKMDP